VGFDFRLTLGLAALAWMPLTAPMLRPGAGDIPRSVGGVAAALATRCRTRIIHSAHEPDAYCGSQAIRRRDRSVRVTGSLYE
jgi:hypothetical protein